MALGRVEVYGRVTRGLLNDRFRRYVEWLVDAVGTRAMKLALTDQNVRVAFWIHGRNQMRGVTLDSHKRARGLIFSSRRGFTPAMEVAMKMMGLKPPRPEQRDITHQTFWHKGARRTRFTIQISPAVLADPFQLPETIIHELKHLTDSIQGKIWGPKWDEPRAENAAKRVLRTLTESELRRAYQEFFGPLLVNRMGYHESAVAREDTRKYEGRVLEWAQREKLARENVRYYRRQPRVRKRT